jgi:dUTP pyrophosphatase
MSNFETRTREIQCLRVDPKAVLPTRAHTTDAGADLYAAEDLEILPCKGALIDTGIAVKIPPGWGGLIDPRSSMRTKGLTCHGTGIIDSAYRGTLKVFVHNMGNDKFVIEKYKTRIGQLTIVPVMLATFVDTWNDTDRGVGGFGSTGV